MILKELLALCDDGNDMITIIREDGMELENARQACCIQAATTRSMMWFPSVCAEGNCTFTSAVSPIGTRTGNSIRQAMV